MAFLKQLPDGQSAAEFMIDIQYSDSSFALSAALAPSNESNTTLGRFFNHVN